MESNIEQINKPLEINETVKSSIEIKYKPAKFFRRVMANLLDFLIFVFVAFALFLGARAITINTNTYKNAFNTYRTEQIQSCLYEDDKTSSYPDVVTYIDKNGNFTHEGKHLKGKNAVVGFYTYIINENVSSEVVETIKNEYATYFSNEKLMYSEDDTKYISSISFNNNEVLIEENNACSAGDLSFYEKVYKPFISTKLLALFANYSPEYKENITKVSNLLVLIDAPICYVVAGLLVYILPPFAIFRRGRMTFGKALYRIALVDSRLLNLTWKRSLARFSIFLFAELILSILTLAVPFIISFSMMAFSKKRQGFPDYMLGCREIDASSNKVYFSLEEINLNNINPHHKPVDFKPERSL